MSYWPVYNINRAISLELIYATGSDIPDHSCLRSWFDGSGSTVDVLPATWNVHVNTWIYWSTTWTVQSICCFALNPCLYREPFVLCLMWKDSTEQLQSISIHCKTHPFLRTDRLLPDGVQLRRKVTYMIPVRWSDMITRLVPDFCSCAKCHLNVTVLVVISPDG